MLVRLVFLGRVFRVFVSACSCLPLVLNNVAKIKLFSLVMMAVKTEAHQL